MKPKINRDAISTFYAGLSCTQQEKNRRQTNFRARRAAKLEKYRQSFNLQLWKKQNYPQESKQINKHQKQPEPIIQHHHQIVKEEASLQIRMCSSEDLESPQIANKKILSFTKVIKQDCIKSNQIINQRNKKSQNVNLRMVNYLKKMKDQLIKNHVVKPAIFIDLDSGDVRLENGVFKVKYRVVGKLQHQNQKRSLIILNYTEENWQKCQQESKIPEIVVERILEKEGQIKGSAQKQKVVPVLSNIDPETLKTSEISNQSSQNTLTKPPQIPKSIIDILSPAQVAGKSSNPFLTTSGENKINLNRLMNSDQNQVVNKRVVSSVKPENPSPTYHIQNPFGNTVPNVINNPFSTTNNPTFQTQNTNINNPFGGNNNVSLSIQPQYTNFQANQVNSFNNFLQNPHLQMKSSGDNKIFNSLVKQPQQGSNSQISLGGLFCQPEAQKSGSVFRSQSQPKKSVQQRAFR